MLYWGIPGILNDESNVSQRYLQLKLIWVTFDPCCVTMNIIIIIIIDDDDDVTQHAQWRHHHAPRVACSVRAISLDGWLTYGRLFPLLFSSASRLQVSPRFQPVIKWWTLSYSRCRGATEPTGWRALLCFALQLSHPHYSDCTWVHLHAVYRPPSTVHTVKWYQTRTRFLVV